MGTRSGVKQNYESNSNEVSCGSSTDHHSSLIHNTSNLLGSNRGKVNKSMSKYFSLLKEKKERMCSINSDNKINQFFSLEEKDFDKPIYHKKIKIVNDFEQVYWKDFFINYINHEIQGGSLWATDLLEFIQKESFSTEFRYQSMAVWKEYEFQMKPKILMNKQYLEELFNNNNFNHSFANLSYEATQDETLVEYKEVRERVINIAMVIKEHLLNSDHPLRIILRSFASLFSTYVDDVVLELNSSRIAISESYIHTSERKSKEIILVLKTFIIKFQTVLKLFYVKCFTYDCFIEEKDEFINLVTTMLFNEKNLYESMFRLEKLITIEDYEKFLKKCNDFAEISPEELDIADKFCLNKCTESLQQQILSKRNNAKAKNNTKTTEPNRTSNASENPDDSAINLYIKDDENKINFNSFNPSPTKMRQPSNDLNLSEIKERRSNKSQPYQSAIDILVNLGMTRSPNEKMKVISNISKAITDCITEFWKDYHFLINKSHLILEADDLMSIFIYILIKSQQVDIVVHLGLIKEFTTKVSKSTMTGYYYCTLEAALIYILGIENIEEFSIKDEERRMMKRESLLKDVNEESF